MDASRIDNAAGLLAEARIAERKVGILPSNCRPESAANAYAIQAILHDRLAAAGHGAVTGWKIGCTTPVMQAMLKIDSPCAGSMTDQGIHRDDATYQLTDTHRAGVECEIAVRLAADADDGPYDRTSVAELVGAVMPAMEIVDDRYDDYTAMTAFDLTADDFFHVACLHGPETTDWRSLDLTGLRGRTLIDGTSVGEGIGGDVMGHPFEALAWLANLNPGRGLRAGDIVMTGSVVATQWINQPATAVTEIDGLGSVTARFG